MQGRHYPISIFGEHSSGLCKSHLTQRTVATDICSQNEMGEHLDLMAMGPLCQCGAFIGEVDVVTGVGPK